LQQTIKVDKMNFFKTAMATVVGLIIFTAIITVPFFIFLIAAISSSDSEVVKLEDESILHLKLNSQILEREVENPFGEIPMFAGVPQGGIGLMELKGAIRQASEDENIAGIFLETSSVMAGISTIDEVREALEEFKESGKFIYSYSKGYSEGAYYLASVADQIFMNPDFAMLELNGLSMESIYMKGLFEKLEVEPIIFKVGDYKEATEPFDRKSMSPAARKRNTELLSKMYDHLLKKIADGRGMTLEEVKHISDSALANLETDALDYGLVDALLYRDQVMEKMAEKMEVENVDDLEFISYKKYRKTYSTYKSSDNRIAVIVASGTIVTGKGESNNIGSATYAKEIRKAADNDKIKAIVLRINSGGGSALASDIMWREVQLAAEKKPIIASMSDYAASGGYYMAMGCDTIVAQANTITGSIGIFSLMFNVENFLGNKLGITTDGVKTGYFSDLYSMTNPLTDYEFNYIQKSVSKGYEVFTGKAAQGRGMAVEEIERLASGRIWTGAEALENGLVDVLGDLDDAVEIAAAKAGVSDDFKVSLYPVQKEPIQELLESLSGDYEAKAMAEKLDELYPYMQSLETLKEMKGIQARELSRVDF
jgi:protease-4